MLVNIENESQRCNYNELKNGIKLLKESEKIFNTYAGSYKKDKLTVQCDYSRIFKLLHKSCFEFKMFNHDKFIWEAEVLIDDVIFFTLLSVESIEWLIKESIYTIDELRCLLPMPTLTLDKMLDEYNKREK